MNQELKLGTLLHEATIFCRVCSCTQCTLHHMRPSIRFVIIMFTIICYYYIILTNDILYLIKWSNVLRAFNTRRV